MSSIKEKLTRQRIKFRVERSDLKVKLQNEKYVRKLTESKVDDLISQIGILKSQYKELEEKSLQIIDEG